MQRVRLAARITIIVLIALTVAWLVAIAAAYKLRDRDGQAARPAPRQVAALAAALEQVSADERPAVLDAVMSPTLQAAIEPGQAAATASSGVGDGDDALRQAYAAAVGDRAFTVIRGRPSGRNLVRRIFGAAPPLEFRVGLSTGDTLVLDVRAPMALSPLGLPVGLLAGLFGTLVALAALVVMQSATRPLSRLATAVDRMDIEDPSSPPLPVTATNIPEIRALVTAFNRLQARLALLMRSRMALLGGISHDVRTFATRLRLRVDQIPEGLERERAIADIADMIRLLDDALLGSRAGAGELAEELVELDEIVRAEVEDRRAAGATIDVGIAPAAAGVAVLGDRLALRRVVSNLADNALKYGGAAHVVLAVDDNALVLLVDDEGPGIPADQREILLEPFVRAEASRNRQTGGAGLGLAVARSLVEAQGGTLTIGDAPGRGARFTVRLPLFRPG